MPGAGWRPDGTAAPETAGRSRREPADELRGKLCLLIGGFEHGRRAIEHGLFMGVERQREAADHAGAHQGDPAARISRNDRSHEQSQLGVEPKYTQRLPAARTVTSVDHRSHEALVALDPKSSELLEYSTLTPWRGRPVPGAPDLLRAVAH